MGARQELATSLNNLTFSRWAWAKFCSLNGGFRKLTEEIVNKRQKPLIFKLLTKVISRF